MLNRFVAEAELLPACERLMSLGREWARRRGGDWSVVLDGPFRRRVLAEALRHAAGRLREPPADLPAMPVGLQAFLRWAIPAALKGGDAVVFDAERSVEVRAAADVLAAELSASPGDEGAPVARGADNVSALLADALATPAPELPPAAAELLALLQTGPVPLREVHRFAAARGQLPGSLLDAIDRVAVHATGSAGTTVEGGVVRLA